MAEKPSKLVMRLSPATVKQLTADTEGSATSIAKHNSAALQSEERVIGLQKGMESEVNWSKSQKAEEEECAEIKIGIKKRIINRNHETTIRILELMRMMRTDAKRLVCARTLAARGQCSSREGRSLHRHPPACSAAQ